MRNKVFLYTDSYTFGGVEKVVIQLVEGLDRDLWEPVLIVHPGNELLPLTQKVDQLNVRKIEIPEMPLGWKGGWKATSFSRILRKEQPQIFHAHLSWPLACKWGIVAAILARVPGLVLSEHLFLDIPYTSMTRLQQRLIAANGANYLADSQYIAGRLLNGFGVPNKNIRVIYNGVDPANFQSKIHPPELARLVRNSGNPVILAIARLHPQKGLGYLIEAAKEISEAVFVIVGDGPERFVLEQQVKELELKERVFFFGFQRDTQNWLNACTVFVLPSLYEGHPLALLEAMAAGKPVVATAIPGNNEAVIPGVTGLLVPPENPKALAKAIRSIVSDAALADRMGRAGRQRVVEEFTVRNMVGQVTRVYEECVKGNH